MCEETHDPSRQVPKAIVGVVGANTVVGLLFMIAMMFVLPDLEYLVNLPSGQPLPAILKSAIGNSTGAFILTLPLIGLCFFAMIGCTTSASRYVWAFARDGGIPGSKWWKTVNRRLDIPLNALLLSMVVQILLGFIYFGSAAAFNAFLGAGVIFLTVSYVSPVAVSLFGGRKDMGPSNYFYLGKLGVFCNVVAVCKCLIPCPTLGLKHVLTRQYSLVPFRCSSVLYAHICTSVCCVDELCEPGIHGIYRHRGSMVLGLGVFKLPRPALGSQVLIQEQYRLRFLKHLRM